MSADDDEFEWWLGASEAEVAREEKRILAEIEETGRRLAMLPIPVQVAYYRRRALESIMTNRLRLRDPKLNDISVVTELWRKHLRRSQMRLVKLRAWRATGVDPGSA